MAPNYLVILTACEENFFLTGSMDSCYCCHCTYFLKYGQSEKVDTL